MAAVSGFSFVWFFGFGLLFVPRVRLPFPMEHDGEFHGNGTNQRRPETESKKQATKKNNQSNGRRFFLFFFLQRRVSGGNGRRQVGRIVGRFRVQKVDAVAFAAALARRQTARRIFQQDATCADEQIVLDRSFL